MILSSYPPLKMEMKQMKVNLRKNFKKKDLGSLHFFLGVSVEQNEEGVSLSQKQYIEKLLKRYGLQEIRKQRSYGI